MEVMPFWQDSVTDGGAGFGGAGGRAGQGGIAASDLAGGLARPPGMLPISAGFPALDPHVAAALQIAAASASGQFAASQAALPLGDNSPLSGGTCESLARAAKRPKPDAEEGGAPSDAAAGGAGAKGAAGGGGGAGGSSGGASGAQDSGTHQQQQQQQQPQQPAVAAVAALPMVPPGLPGLAGLPGLPGLPSMAAMPGMAEMARLLFGGAAASAGAANGGIAPRALPTVPGINEQVSACYWVLLGATGCYWVLLGATGWLAAPPPELLYSARLVFLLEMSIAPLTHPCRARVLLVIPPSHVLCQTRTARLWRWPPPRCRCNRCNRWGLVSRP